MGKIRVLDQNTINKIAAGEVIDRPASVVKELLENAIDAQATSVTVEIKDGGISFLRITDNGQGIAKEDIRPAFLRHSTSKITDARDLMTISSLGFRGEALSSIAAVAQVELISRQPADITGVRYVIEGGTEKSYDEIGAPSGTTFIIRNLFYNVPARKKFLKANQTEAGYIYTIVEKIALSHPDVSIRFINNNASKLFTAGNRDLKNIIYNIFGKEAAQKVIEIQTSSEFAAITGYVGKPEFSRGNRDYETFFVNGRYIKSSLISKAVEEAYRPYSMQHKYPFAVLHIEIQGDLIDVNVHPSKMEIRIKNQEEIFEFIHHTLKEALQERESIPEIVHTPKPSIQNTVRPGSASSKTVPPRPAEDRMEPFEAKRIELVKEAPVCYDSPPLQMELFSEKFLSPESLAKHRIIGQLFDTYWLIEFEDKLFIIDQHAAHEKVLYERVMTSLKSRSHSSQILAVPMIVSLSMAEEDLLGRFMEQFRQIGYDIEEFGGNEFAIRAVPDNLFSLNTKELFLSMLDELAAKINPSLSASPEATSLILEKIASVSCKAAVKGNQKLSHAEMDALIKELLTLENPYNCPHGRPTIISMSRQELSKKFKRIL
ncbi:DNA mismatch repair endonuclease MutL [Parasporobacterium paucivorans]|uniref:DNA mismatch repair protein MutL n=1 Tax=Parasporobacterium paucivorans DSM 15970 TaxID=1122934 RepID=A0A1M6A259_9FIRM|nr:DNA mismatch repair endonuclease MutL [Parasporobacterium paucivorans]SHI30536.1 DNA mismatch repair protein MutL [Parasporobacterium paucivorans DSM 15970]